TDGVDAALAAFDLAPLAARAVGTLWAGQRRRTALRRVVATGAPLWLLDEPLNALDAASQAALRTVLERHLAGGGLAIAATHAPLEGARVLDIGLFAGSAPLHGTHGVLPREDAPSEWRAPGK